MLYTTDLGRICCGAEFFLIIIIIIIIIIITIIIIIIKLTFSYVRRTFQERIPVLVMICQCYRIHLSADGFF